MFVALSLSAHAATAIGHPDVHGAVATGLSFDSLAVWVDAIQLRRCDGQPVAVEVDEEIAAGEPLILPQGCFDRLRVHTAWVRASGTGNGGTFALDLAPGEIDVLLPGDFSIPGTAASALVLGETDWVTASMLGLSTGVHVDVAAGHALYAPLSVSLRDESALDW